MDSLDTSANVTHKLQSPLAPAYHILSFCNKIQHDFKLLFNKLSTMQKTLKHYTLEKHQHVCLH